MKTDYKHIPVLKEEVLNAFDYLKGTSDPIFVDGTLGLAGHSIAIAKQILRNKKQETNFNVIGIDKDQNAINTANKLISENCLAKNFALVHDDFKNIKKVLHDHNIERVDGILLDLGVSSMQIDEKARGFSYSDLSQLLDMRMDQSSELDAYSVVNNYCGRELERVLRDGEERYFKVIARNILKARRDKPIKTVGDLLEILQMSLPKKIVGKFARTYAADTFRAIRLEVNQELSNLEQSLKDCVDVLSPGGRLAVITFHSLEDRIAKNVFRDLQDPCICPKELPYCVCGLKPIIKFITKKPIAPTEEEQRTNPRSKSSKLRVVEKI